MSEELIAVHGLTKDYGHGRGVFGLDFAVQAGECFGYLGPNGAGKTTTLRLLMGFTKTSGGSANIAGLDCFADAARLHEQVGYLPGELALMEEMTGWQFIELMAGMKKLHDLTRAKALADRFELDGKAVIRRMSKGTKQKVGLVCAFMANPAVLLLDEPTSGLDPLMQSRFIQLLQEEKQRGATILLSSHLFEEVERTCDRAAILRSGKIARQDTLDNLRKTHNRQLRFRFPTEEAAAQMAKAFPGAAAQGKRVELTATADQVAPVLGAAARLGVRDVQSRTQTLEELFLHLYGGEQ